jgi:arylsulfatase A-like enzyme
LNTSVISKVFDTVNEWFDEATSRFQIIVITAGVLSIILTIILLLQPLVTKVKTMPVLIHGQPSLPNVIFIVADALGTTDMSLFGYPLSTTPELEKITQNWAVFSNVQSPQTCTVAALPTLTTGRYTYTNDFTYYGDQVTSQPGWLSLPNALEQAGYQTWWSGYHSPGFYHMGSAFNKSVCRSDDNLYVTLIHSWFRARPFFVRQFPYIPFTLDQFGMIEEGRTDFGQCEELEPFDNLVQFGNLNAPFFIFYHYRGSHGFPYLPGSFLGAFLPESEGFISLNDQFKVFGAYKPEDQPLVEKLRLRYDESIANQDHQLGAFIESVKQRGLYDSSMIIITSDHGQNFENGFLPHCTPLVSQMESGVPLLIKYPGQTEGQRFDFLASTIDIVPTVFDVLGMDYPANWLDGISLLKQAAQPDQNRIVFTRRYSYASNLIPTEIAASDGRYRLIRREEKLFLFDITKDPLEKENLLDQNGYDQLTEFKGLQQALENYRQRASSLLAGESILAMPALIP